MGSSWEGKRLTLPITKPSSEDTGVGCPEIDSIIEETLKMPVLLNGNRYVEVYATSSGKLLGMREYDLNVSFCSEVYEELRVLIGPVS